MKIELQSNCCYAMPVASTVVGMLFAAAIGFVLGAGFVCFLQYLTNQ